MWMVNSKVRGQKEVDQEFCPHPSNAESRETDGREKLLANKVLILQFVKSPMSVNPGMVKKLAE